MAENSKRPKDDQAYGDFCDHCIFRRLIRGHQATIIQEVAEAIRILDKDKFPRAKIGRLFGLSQWVIDRIVELPKTSQPIPERRPGKPLTSKQEATLREMWEAGHTVREIAGAIGYGHNPGKISARIIRLQQRGVLGRRRDFSKKSGK